MFLASCSPLCLYARCFLTGSVLRDIRTERVAWYSGQSYEWEKNCGRSDTKWMTHNYREAMRIYQNMKNELTDSIEFRTMDDLGQYLSRRFGPCYIALYQ